MALLKPDAPEVNGSDLLLELQDTAARVRADAEDRDSVVQARLRALEAEAVDLSKVQKLADSITG